MKTYKVLLISTAVLGLLLGGVLAFQTRAEVITLAAVCRPQHYSMEDPTPMYFKITLSDFPKGKIHNTEHVDPATLLVGGVVEMAPGVEPNITDKHFKFDVIGAQLMDWIVLPQIWHMSPDPHTRVPIDVTVTGQFYDSEAFEGTFTLTVFTEKEELDPNNPQPEP